MNCTCLNCGWVHMAVTKSSSLAEVSSFNEYYEKQTDEVKGHFAGPSKIEDYIGCFRCGKNEFRESKDDDCPRGVTIQPTIWEP